MTSHDDLAKRFVQGATKGRSSTMFIEGDSVYSYGHHFRIAQRKPYGYLFNTEGYSHTTAKHKSTVRHAIRNNKIIEMINCNDDHASRTKTLTSNHDEIMTLFEKLKRSRKRKEMYADQINHLLQQNELILKHYPDTTKGQYAVKPRYNLDELRAYLTALLI